MRDKNVGDQVLPRAAKKSGRSTEVVSLLVAAQSADDGTPLGESPWRGKSPRCAFGVPKSPVTGSNAWRAPSATLCPAAKSPLAGHRQRPSWSDVNRYINLNYNAKTALNFSSRRID